ncbi:hypothetical protein BpHYR1_035803 [Brachionus plicatilis]|uniref:Uncharacterized protein n=1 Tax=Brachionus plicatilis TaxID=10195 RepID=A0A3M7QV59_BRAPC|nr:hypothetical protein BpHYR1_035803 [Brachionus plicatilis]
MIEYNFNYRMKQKESGESKHFEKLKNLESIFSRRSGHSVNFPKKIMVKLRFLFNFNFFDHKKLNTKTMKALTVITKYT